MLANIIAADGSRLTGKVRKVSPMVDMQTRNTIVYLDLPANSVKAGMFAKGDFAMGQSNTLSIPQQALVLRDGFNYVFVVKNMKNQQAQVGQIKVQTGKRVGNLVEVVSGLTANQNVVASGGAFLSDNDMVKVVKMVNAELAKGTPAKKLMQLK